MITSLENKTKTYLMNIAIKTIKIMYYCYVFKLKKKLLII